MSEKLFSTISASYFFAAVPASSPDENCSFSAGASPKYRGAIEIE